LARKSYPQSRYTNQDPKTSKSKRNFLPFINPNSKAGGIERVEVDVTRVHRKAANLGEEKEIHAGAVKQRHDSEWSNLMEIAVVLETI